MRVMSRQKDEAPEDGVGSQLLELKAKNLLPSSPIVSISGQTSQGSLLGASDPKEELSRKGLKQLWI